MIQNKSAHSRLVGSRDRLPSPWRPRLAHKVRRLTNRTLLPQAIILLRNVGLIGVVVELAGAEFVDTFLQSLLSSARWFDDIFAVLPGLLVFDEVIKKFVSGHVDADGFLFAAARGAEMALEPASFLEVSVMDGSPEPEM